MRAFLRKLIARESDPKRLTRSIAAGVAIAVSPYLTLMTWILFPLCWLISANAAIAITVLWTVNNPWTMIPFIVADYFVGYVLFELLLGWDLTAYNPWFMEWVNNNITPYVTPYLGIDDFCFWCFIGGGTVVAIVSGFVTYWMLYPILRKQLARNNADEQMHDNAE